MKDWTDEDLLRLDARYAEEGVHPHQRPFRAAVALLGPGFSIGPPGFGNREAIDEIVAAYRRLVPGIDDARPGAGIGIVASLDRVRKVILPVMFGDGWIEVWRDLGFDSPQDWFDWCRGDPVIAVGSEFAYADLRDFCYGRDAIRGRNRAADELWTMARSNLEDVANTLPAGFSMESVLQPIYLIVELALKACLVWHDVNLKAEGFTRPKNGHDLVALSRRLREVSPHRDDALVATYVTEMPAYVASRYSPQELTRLRVVKLALAAQFIAASTLRRVSGEDLAAEMEATSDSPGQRPPLFPTS